MVFFCSIFVVKNINLSSTLHRQLNRTQKETSRFISDQLNNRTNFGIYKIHLFPCHYTTQ